jgi:hypothetical protein
MIIWKDLKGIGSDLTEVLSRHLRGGSEENHEKLSQENRCSGTSWIWVKSSTAVHTRSVKRSVEYAVQLM